jgi:hypothetical protein
MELEINGVFDLSESGVIGSAFSFTNVVSSLIFLPFGPAQFMLWTV